MTNEYGGQVGMASAELPRVAETHRSLLAGRYQRRQTDALAPLRSFGIPMAVLLWHASAIRRLNCWFQADLPIAAGRGADERLRQRHSDAGLVVPTKTPR